MKRLALVGRKTGGRQRKIGRVSAWIVAKADGATTEQTFIPTPRCPLPPRPVMRPLAPIVLALAATLVSEARGANDYENAPIHYSTTTPNDAAQELMRRMEAGSVKIDRRDAWSVLRDLCRQFDIPEASQVLVFSKTSKQNHLIDPQTPRLIWFGDNAYLGYCLGGSIEVATIDPLLGPVFYLLEPNVRPDQPLVFERDQSCLSCHGGPFSPDVPGVLVRSVFPGREGHPIMSRGSTVVDTTTPFEDRWGGWYVTGSHGAGRHRGNTTLDERDDNDAIDPEPGANRTDLSAFFDTQPYPAPTSDIVALMVLEHQTSTQNVLTKAHHAALRAMHRQQSLQRELGEPVLAEPTGTALRIIDNAALQVLDALLFKDEATLPDGGIDGDPAFQEQFARHAPRSADGRSLKDFQLLTRLFKHRCSYMIHSLTFQHLQPHLKKTVLTRLAAVLKGEDPDDRYAYLSESERGHIQRILADTLPAFELAAQ